MPQAYRRLRNSQRLRDKQAERGIRLSILGWCLNLYFQRISQPTRDLVPACVGDGPDLKMTGDPGIRHGGIIGQHP